MSYLNIHDFMVIKLSNMPLNITEFINNELGYFVVNKANSCDVNINFVDKLKSKDKFRKTTNKLSYYSNKIRFECDRGALILSLESITEYECLPKLNVSVENTVGKFYVLYIIEKIIMFLLPLRGGVVMHASAYANKEKCEIYISYQGGGKTKKVLNEVYNGADFIGDDLVIIDGYGNLYCYPRRINIHKFNISNYWEIFFLMWYRKLFSKSFYMYLIMFIKHVLYKQNFLGYIRLSLSEIFKNKTIVIAREKKCDNLLIFNYDFNKTINDNDRLSQFIMSNNLFELTSRIQNEVISSFIDSDSLNEEIKIYTKKSIISHRSILNSFINKS